MSNSSASSEKLDQRLVRGSKQLFVWTLAWLLSTAALAFGPKLIWQFNSAITLSILVLNVLLGIKLIFAFKAHLQDMDEMQQKIHFNAMAISLGSTFIAGNIFGLLEPAGLTESTTSPSNLLFVMGISYLITVIVNFRRYS